MKTQSLRARKRGFTLIELLVVIIILAILAAVVIPRVIGRTEDARISTALNNIQSFKSALDLYNLDNKHYPTNEEGLNVLTQKSGNGPYLKDVDTVPADPWGHPYRYKSPGENGREFDISSDGPDGQTGTNDDIQSWNVQGK